MAHIVVIEDEPGIVDFIGRGLRAAGLEVTSTGDGETGERLALGPGVDLVVLDLMLPRRSGAEVLDTLARERPGLPVIVLTARGEIDDRVAGLNAGAVDYLVKPFAFAELEARIRAHLRAAERVDVTSLAVGPLRADLLSHRVTHDGETVHLSGTEFGLLCHLMRNPGEVVSRADILRAVWGSDHDPRTNIVDVYVGYLRRRLGDSGRTPVRITAVRARGYRLDTGE